MSFIQRTVVLTGVHKGKTINLRGIYPFENGELTLEGNEEDVYAEVRNLERNFSAYLKGDPRLEVEITTPPSLGGERTNPADPLSPMTNDLLKGNEDGQRDLSAGGDNADGQGQVQGGGLAQGEGTSAGDGANDGSGAGDASTGATGGLPEGNGQPPLLKVSDTLNPNHAPEGDAKALFDVKLQRAVASLDHATDDHWTQDGKPALQAVSKFYGSTAVKRADVEAVAPEYRRGNAPLTPASL